MQVIKDVAYNADHGVRGLLDVYVPDGGRDLPIVMVIHGGGLRSLSKERMSTLTEWVAEQGWAAVNVNYRLLPDNPFPAPLADVLDAFQWVKDGKHPALADQDRTRISVMGGSAGGYLVCMMGLLLGKDEVRSVVDISGPTTKRRTDKYRADELPEGSDERWFRTPVELAHADAPPFLCTHSTCDGVVSFSESEKMVEALQEVGASAELYAYEGPDKLHGVWTEQEAPSPHLLPHLKEKIASFLRKTL